MRIAVVAGAAAACLLASMAVRAARVGELGLLDSRVVASQSRDQFDAAAWRDGDPRARGAMAADLLRHHRFVGLGRDSVAALLGPSTCYAGQEYFNCFLLEIDGRPYQLELITTHEGPVRRVASVNLSSR